MSRPIRPMAKGWCPGAYTPMMSGDGLVVRVRPMLARLTDGQALTLCDLALRYGSGLIDLTSRANLQIRGVAEADYEALLADLNAAGLLPDDPSLEARRNVLIAPDWTAGDLTETLTTSLVGRLAELPELPAKFGFAIDCGLAPILTKNSADIRIERSKTGLVLRADSAATGRVVDPATAVDELIQLANWFVDTGGAKSGRMARHLQATPLPAVWTGTAALPPRAELAPGASFLGTSPLGAAYGAVFGQIEAQALAKLIKTSGCRALRITPWRLFLTEDAAPVATSGFLTQADDPLRKIDACPGLPLCASASVETRALARKLAGRTDKSLHISGCAKGCARPRPADLTLVGRNGAFDLVRAGRPWDDPAETQLTEDDILSRIGAL